jgi:large subunit ribosomal protein L34
MLGKLKKRKRLRTHGFLKRSITANGRKVLRNRRRKWRLELTPTYARSLKKTKWKAKLHIVPSLSKAKVNKVVKPKIDKITDK